MDFRTLQGELAKLSRQFEERYEVDLSDLRASSDGQGLVIEGSVVARKQLEALKKRVPSDVELRVEVLAELPPSDIRLDLWLSLGIGKAIAVYSAPSRQKLATEWTELDGLVRVLAGTEDARLIQLPDATCGWIGLSDGLVAESPSVELFPDVLEANGHIPAGAESVQDLVNRAYRLAEREVPYKLGGRTLSGIDCSAFVQRLFFDCCGRWLPRHSSDQMKRGARVARGDLQPADLFFARTLDRSFMHVGFMLPEGRIAHACLTEGAVVCESIETFGEKYRFLKARRLLSPS